MRLAKNVHAKKHCRKAQNGENTFFSEMTPQYHTPCSALCLSGGGSLKPQLLAGEEVKVKSAGCRLLLEPSANKVV